jgi:hypothetical protein
MRIVTTAILSICLFAAESSESQWSIEKPMDEIPDTPLKGKIVGRDFELGSAEIGEHALTISSKKKSGLWPESGLLIFVGTKDDKKEWVVTPDTKDAVPHIHMKFARKGRNLPDTLMFTSGYSMRLVFTKVTKTKVEGKLHISLPDKKKSYLVGAFTAKVK